MTTDTERLNWLTRSCDIGRISLDPDLEGTPTIHWNVWHEGAGYYQNPRDAIDAAMIKYQKQEEALKALEFSEAHK